jgi:glycosyltransferase involved in cell wall biosynthesis
MSKPRATGKSSTTNLGLVTGVVVVLLAVAVGIGYKWEADLTSFASRTFLRPSLSTSWLNLKSKQTEVATRSTENTNEKTEKKEQEGEEIPGNQMLTEQKLCRSLLWMGPIFSGGGYSSEGISFVVELSKYMTVGVEQHGDAVDMEFVNGLPTSLADQLMGMYMNRVDPANSFVVCHSEAGAWHPALYKTSICPPPRSLYVIGRTMFETDRIPKGWAERCNRDLMNEIWVPTEFHRETFVRSGVRPDKIFVIPEAVDVDTFDPDRVGPLQDLPGYPDTQNHFKFLSIFKWEERKGWDILLRAFFEEFSEPQEINNNNNTINNNANNNNNNANNNNNNTNSQITEEEGEEALKTSASLSSSSSSNDSQVKVALYILTNAFHAEDGFNVQDKINQVAEPFRKSGKKLPFVGYFREHVPQASLPSLYKSVDAFVLPTRGEGWGRPLAEAMSMGLPVIATNWSGQTHFMNDENSFLIKIDGLTEITKGPWKGHKWAEPNVESLRGLMREVVADRDKARAKAAAARRDMVHKWSPSVVGQIAFQRLVQIDKMLSKK